MKKNKKIIVFPILIILVVAAALLYNYLNRVILYKDEHTLGNTGGNLNNGGLFCESDDRIYFSNLEDEGKLYSMSTDLTDFKKLYDDNASYINAAGPYVFYTRRNDRIGSASGFLSFSNTGLYRVTTKGKKIGRLYGDPTQAAALYGNYVYYQHYDKQSGLQLYKAKIDGSEDIKLLESAVLPCSIDTNMIYYAGEDGDSSIYGMSVNSGDTTKIYEGNCYLVTAAGNYLYYIDLNQQYALCRVEKNGSNPEILVEADVSTYNVSQDGGSVYYQQDSEEDNGLYVCNPDNKETRLIQAGSYNYLHLTKDYLFFQTYDQSTCYVMTLDDEDIELFIPEVIEK